MSSGVFDYSQVVGAFAAKLAELDAHITEHNHIEDAEQVSAEISHCLSLIAALDEFESFEKEEQVWNELWNYVRDNMRKWWD